MRSVTFAAALLMSLATISANADELLWDNYPGDVLEDATYNMSSERNTEVIESTWIVDDVDTSQAPPPLGGLHYSLIQLTRLEWVGARDPGFDPYPTADVILLDTNLDTYAAVVLEDLSYTFTDFDPDPNPDPDTQTYLGVIEFDPPIAIPGEHFYIGARLVGGGWYEGRNHSVTSSIDADIFGQTEGHIQAAVFGAPPPNWRPASVVWYGGDVPSSNFEFAFRVYGIPEPASLGLLVVGSLMLVRRR